MLLLAGAAAGSFGYSLAAAALSGGAAWLTLYGGRRSDAGRQTLQTALGLRRYFMTVDRKQLRRIVLRNPGYYYDMAPYALALGADAVLIGRPFVTAVYGGGAEGVRAYVDKLRAELTDTMAMCGAHSLSEITPDMVRLPK